MEGRLCLVTGASSGIGFATCKGLAERGATVIMACRDGQRGAAAAAAVRAVSRSGAVESMQLDLASLASIHDFAAQVQNWFGRLDVLINNAGVATRSRQRTADGFELQFGVNHLGHFALTRLLLPLLEQSTDGRVAVVSSALHRAGKIAWDDLQSDKQYRMMQAYAQSKLANILFARELARRSPALAVNALHPGGAATAIMRELPAPARALIRVFSGSPERAAQGSIHLAASDSARGISGRYFVRCTEQPPAAAAQDAEAARRLWEVSEALVG